MTKQVNTWIALGARVTFDGYEGDVITVAPGGARIRCGDGVTRFALRGRIAVPPGGAA